MQEDQIMNSDHEWPAVQERYIKMSEMHEIEMEPCEKKRPGHLFAEPIPSIGNTYELEVLRQLRYLSIATDKNEIRVPMVKLRKVHNELAREPVDTLSGGVPETCVNAYSHRFQA